MPPEANSALLLILIALGFAAGFLNAIAGGAGLLTLPVLLSVGVPPINALATSKFQAVFGTLSSTFNYFRKGLIDFRVLWPVCLIGMFAALLGTLAVQHLPSGLLQQVIPYFLIVLALYTWFSPQLDNQDRPAKLSTARFNWSIGSSIGFYGGFFGPGMGAMTALAFAHLRGYNLRKATAYAKPLVVLCNIASTILFISGGHVWFLIGISMAVAQVFGARLGSNLVIQKGAAIVKPLIVITTLVIAVKMMIDG